MPKLQKTMPVAISFGKEAWEARGMAWNYLVHHMAKRGSGPESRGTAAGASDAAASHSLWIGVGPPQDEGPFVTASDGEAGGPWPAELHWGGGSLAGHGVEANDWSRAHRTVGVGWSCLAESDQTGTKRRCEARMWASSGDRSGRWPQPLEVVGERPLRRRGQPPALGPLLEADRPVRHRVWGSEERPGMRARTRGAREERRPPADDMTRRCVGWASFPKPAIPPEMHMFCWISAVFTDMTI